MLWSTGKSSGVAQQSNDRLGHTNSCRKSVSHFIVRFESTAVSTVYPKKYAHGFVVLCLVVVTQSFIMNSHEVYIHIHQGCFAGTGAIVRLPQCQWSKPDGYGKISQCITTTKHSKAKTVCIFLGIYCTHVNDYDGQFDNTNNISNDSDYGNVDRNHESAIIFSRNINNTLQKCTFSLYCTHWYKLQENQSHIQVH